MWVYIQQRLVGTELEKALQIGIKQKRGAAIKEIEETVLSALTVAGVRKEQAALAAAQPKVPEEVAPGTWEDEEVVVEDGLVDESEVHVTPVPRKLVMEVCWDSVSYIMDIPLLRVVCQCVLGSYVTVSN